MQSEATILEQFRVENCVVSELSLNLFLGTSGYTAQSGKILILGELTRRRKCMGKRQTLTLVILAFPGAIFDMYIGNVPICEETKEEIGKNVASIIRGC